MSTSYEADVVAWANEQASLLRAGRFELLDRDHIAEEIEDVGKSEQRELASRMSVLLAHLLQWRYQPERRGASWEKTILAQRKEIAYGLSDAPSITPRCRKRDGLKCCGPRRLLRRLGKPASMAFPTPVRGRWKKKSSMMPGYRMPEDTHRE
jgi:hypothetical protein